MEKDNNKANEVEEAFGNNTVNNKECIISSEKINEANKNDSLDVSESYHKIVNNFKVKEINPEELQELFENWVYNNSKG